MATTTPRLNLTKPDGTDLVDIAVINANYDKIDAASAAGTIVAQNYIINGDFSINQRNFSSVTGSGFGFDRWILGSNGGTVTYSAQSFTVGVAPVSGYEATNFARLAVSGQSSAGHYAQLVQRIEDVRTFAGQTATVSFWAKAASGTPKVLPSLYQSFGSGGSAGVANQDATVTLSTSWARYSVTIPVASISGKTVGAGSYLQTALLVSGEGSAVGVQNNTFDIWGVQVEAGSVMTAFRRNANSIQGELAACQRYYQRISGSDGLSYTIVASGMQLSTTAANFLSQLPVQMRQAPAVYGSSLTVTNLTGFGEATNSTGNLAQAGNSKSVSFWGVTWPSARGSINAMIFAYPGSTGFIEFVAEL